MQRKHFDEIESALLFQNDCCDIFIQLNILYHTLNMVTASRVY